MSETVVLSKEKKKSYDLFRENSEINSASNKF